VCPVRPRFKRRRREPSIPKELRREVAQFVRMIARKYRKQLASDPQLKARLLRLAKALLPPRPRRPGRPRNPVITDAIMLHAKFRRQFPADQPRSIWARVYPLAIPGYDAMPEVEQRTAREKLRERIAWRRRKRRPRKIPAEITV